MSKLNNFNYNLTTSKPQKSSLSFPQPALIPARSFFNPTKNSSNLRSVRRSSMQFAQHLRTNSNPKSQTSKLSSPWRAHEMQSSETQILRSRIHGIPDRYQSSPAVLNVFALGISWPAVGEQNKPGETPKLKQILEILFFSWRDSRIIRPRGMINSSDPTATTTTHRQWHARTHEMWYPLRGRRNRFLTRAAMFLQGPKIKEVHQRSGAVPR